MFVKMEHVALSVRDMDKALAFYCDVIGFEKVFDREFDVQMARLLGIEGTQVRIVHLKLGGSMVELFDYKCPKGREPRRNRLQSDFGLTHIGFEVEDFWGTYQHLLDHGVKFLTEPFEFRPGVFVGYFHGAEYEVCEIKEIVPQA